MDGSAMGSRASFGVRVAEAVGRLGPLCAGIDPSGALLESWGLSDDVKGLRTFCRICVEAFGGVVPVIKPQVAFFERHGSAGMAELERLLVDAAGSGLLVLADAKRGDIDTTAAAYAEAWLREGSTLAADAVTAHPYLGVAALAPLVQVAAGSGRGVIVVTRSSNPEGRSLQQAVTRFGGLGGGLHPGRDRRVERLRRRADRDGGRRDRRHAGNVGISIRPAGRRNFGARTGRTGRATGRSAGSIRRVQTRKCPGQHLAEPPRDRARSQGSAAGGHRVG